MASSNKTAYLKLNQWAASDPVLRADFNADNAILDAALRDSPWIRLTDVTTVAEVEQVNLNLSSIDVSKIFEYRIYTSYDGPVAGNVAGSGRIRINSMTTDKYYNPNGAYDYLTYCSSRHLTTLRHIPGQRLWAFLQFVALSGDESSGAVSGYSTAGVLSRINTINFYVSEAKVPVGTRFTVFGLR